MDVPCLLFLDMSLKGKSALSSLLGVVVLSFGIVGSGSGLLSGFLIFFSGTLLGDGITSSSFLGSAILTFLLDGSEVSFDSYSTGLSEVIRISHAGCVLSSIFFP